MAKTQKFNASVNFGATVDGSVGRTLNRLTSGIDDISSTSLKAMGVQTKWMRDLQSGSAGTANKIKTMEQATTALLKKQEALEKEIREGVKAGKNVSELATEYQKVAVGISRASKELESLNAQRKQEEQQEQARQEHEDKLQRKRQKRWDRIYGASMAPVTATKAIGRTAWSATKTGTAMGLGAAIAIPASIIALNKKTAEEAALAKSYGLTYERYKAGSILSEQAGLNGENFGDLAEELSNKVGQEGNDKTLNQMLSQIGLTKRHLAGKTKQQMFDIVMQSITSAVKDKKMAGTAGESLADQLMGGEANKLSTYIIGLGQTYSEVLANASKLNNVTNAEAEGAVASSRVLSNLWISAETAMQGAAGELGEALAPTLQKMESEAISWIKENKDNIAKSIGDWASGGGPKRLVDGLELFGQEVIAVGEKLKWLLPDPDKMNKDQQTITDYLAMGNSMEGAKSLANEYDLEDWFSQQHFDDPSKLQAIRDDWKLQHSPVDAGIDTVQNTPISSQSPVVQPQQTNHVQIVVQTLPEQSADEVGQSVYEKFQKGLPGGGFNLSTGNAFDTPQ